MGCFLGQMLRGVGPATRAGLRVIRGTFMNPLGNLSANTLRSKIFLTSVSIRASLGCRFKINVSDAQKSKGMLGCEVVTEGNLV